MCKPFGASVSRRNNNACSIRISFCFFTDSRHTFLRFFRLFFDIKKKKTCQVYICIQRAYFSCCIYMIPITANIYFLLQDAHQENEHRLEIYRENKKFGSHIILLTKRKAPFSRTICTAKYIPVLWGGGYIRE